MNTESVIAVIHDLVGFKTTKGHPEEIDKCITYIKDFYKNTGIHIEEFEHNKVKSLFISYDRQKTPTLLLSGHIDVVDAEEKDFIPHREDIKLYGRGAWDMKAGVAVCMHLLRDFAEQKPSVALMLTSDEEVGGANGTGFLASQGYGGKIVLAAEQNSSDDPGQLNLTVGGKGILWIKIKAQGKASHGSHPWEGENAIEKLMTAYQKIKELFPDTTPENRWKKTLNLGIIKGGDAPNKVPEVAEMTLDIRWTEDESPESILQSIKGVDGIDVEVTQKEPMLHNNEQDEVLQKLKKITIEQVTNKPCELRKSHGASDVRYTSNKGMTSVMTGTSGANLHAQGEYVDLDSVNLLYEALKKFIEQL